MSRRNTLSDVAIIHLLERDLVTVGQALEYDLPLIETLVLRAAQNGLLDELTAGNCGQAIGRLHDALTALKKWLAIFRDSRPQEVMIVEIAQTIDPDEKMALLVELPPEPDDTILNRLIRGFRQLHGADPTHLCVANRSRLPQSLRRAALGKLTIEEDTSIQPGRARLLA